MGEGEKGVNNTLSNSSNKAYRPKYGFFYIITLPALLLVFIFKVIPAVMALILPFKNYNVAAGMQSPWVGSSNFDKLLSGYHFTRVVGNTIMIRLEYLIIASLVALVLSITLSMVRNKKIRNLFSAIFVAPYFIPAVIISYLVMIIFSTKSPIFEFATPPLVNPATFRIIYVLVEVARNVGIPTIIAAASIEGHIRRFPHRKDFLSSRLIPVLKALAAFIFIQFSVILTVDSEVLSMLINPLVYQVADTLGTYAYRAGFAQSAFSLNATLWLIRIVIQTVLVLGSYFVIRYFLRDSLFTGVTDDEKGNIDNVSHNNDGSSNDDKEGIMGKSKEAYGFRDNPLSYVLCTVFALFALFPFIFMIVQGFFKSDSTGGLSQLLGNSPIIKSFALYFTVTLVAVIFNAFITVTLAYPLTAPRLPGKAVYKLMLLLLVSLGTGGIHEYLFNRSLGTINTIFPLITGGLFSFINVFVIKSIFNSKHQSLMEEAFYSGKRGAYIFANIYLPRVWKPLLGLAVLQFVTMWNSFTSSVTYMSNPLYFSPTALFRNITVISYGSIDIRGIDITSPAVMKLAILITLPSILLFVIFRKFLTSEVFISQTRQ